MGSFPASRGSSETFILTSTLLFLVVTLDCRGPARLITCRYLTIRSLLLSSQECIAQVAAMVAFIMHLDGPHVRSPVLMVQE